MERAELNALLRGTGCAEEIDGCAFLIDPRWGELERNRVRMLVDAPNGKDQSADEGWICIPTGGTSGEVKFARHDEHTLSAAARGFAAHFGIVCVNAVDVLPPFHVSGLMARIRCAETGGVHVSWDWKRLEAGERPVLGGGEWVLSLVPTQLQRLLRNPAATNWLRGFRAVFIGGGPVWPALTDSVAAADLRVSLSYGMTETAAMVAAQLPEEFLAGDRSCGRVLPHAGVRLDGNGVIRVSGASLFRGYHPDGGKVNELETADLGAIDANGRLHVLGRRDDVIISGGEKVNPLEVEAALLATGEFTDVAVVGIADPEWGRSVVACYPSGGSAPDLDKVNEAITQQLAGPKRPKRYVRIDPWPRTAQGKLNRRALVTQLEATRS